MLDNLLTFLAIAVPAALTVVLIGRMIGRPAVPDTPMPHLRHSHLYEALATRILRGSLTKENWERFVRQNCSGEPDPQPVDLRQVMVVTSAMLSSGWREVDVHFFLSHHQRINRIELEKLVLDAQHAP